MAAHQTARSFIPLLFFLGSAACSGGDPAGSSGSGRVAFTSWGEEYIEQGIGVASGTEAGFVDGWSIHYEKFLVNIQRIVIASSKGETAASADGAKLFDHTKPGVKPVVSFDSVPGAAWDRVSYEIAPVTTASELASGVTEADRTLMANAGYSVYFEATATKETASMHYAWGFALGTAYKECHAEAGGKDQAGIVVTNNSSVDVELTIHGDHPYYDRLQASPDPSIETSLRFEAIALADANADGEITLAELDAVPLDVTLYNPTGLPAATQGAFVSQLVRTIGHFRGEGECTVNKL